MTSIDNTALGRLDKEGRLLNAVLKGDTTKPGRFGFRGDIALKFQAQVADEKRPPDYSIEQVLTVAQEGEETIPVLAGYLHSYAYLADGTMLNAELILHEPWHNKQQRQPEGTEQEKQIVSAFFFHYPKYQLGSHSSR